METKLLKLTNILSKAAENTTFNQFFYRFFIGSIFLQSAQQKFLRFAANSFKFCKNQKEIVKSDNPTLIEFRQREYSRLRKLVFIILRALLPCFVS